MRDDERYGPTAPELEPQARSKTDATTLNEAGELSRRELFKVLATTGALVGAHMMLPREWTVPVVDVGALPAHAATSGASVSGFTFTATRNPDKSVTLAWTTPAGTDSIEIFRTVEGQAEQRIAVADTSALNMIDFTASSAKLSYRGQIKSGAASASVAGAP